MGSFKPPSDGFDAYEEYQPEDELKDTHILEEDELVGDALPPAMKRHIIETIQKFSYFAEMQYRGTLSDGSGGGNVILSVLDADDAEYLKGMLPEGYVVEVR